MFPQFRNCKFGAGVENIEKLSAISCASFRKVPDSFSILAGMAFADIELMQRGLSAYHTSEAEVVRENAQGGAHQIGTPKFQGSEMQ